MSGQVAAIRQGRPCGPRRPAGVWPGKPRPQHPSQRGSQVVEYLLLTPLVVALVAAVTAQMVAAALAALTSASSARDGALAAVRGQDPLLAARQAAPGWQVAVTEVQAVTGGEVAGVRVQVTVQVPVVPLRALPLGPLAVTCSAAVPASGSDAASGNRGGD